MTTYTADQFRALAKAGEFWQNNDTIEVRNSRGELLERGSFAGISLALTGPYDADPRFGTPQPDYPGAGKHVPYFSFTDKPPLRFESSQTVTVV